MLLAARLPLQNSSREYIWRFSIVRNWIRQLWNKRTKLGQVEKSIQLGKAASVEDTASRGSLHALCRLPVSTFGLPTPFKSLTYHWITTFILTHTGLASVHVTPSKGLVKGSSHFFLKFPVVYLCSVLNYIVILKAHMNTFSGSFPEITM